MNRPSVEVFTDDQITSRVLDILRNAKKHVTLVSPYNKFWTHLRNELQRTVARDVRVDFIYRNGERSEDTDWLEDLGVRVHAVQNLHAKIYLNESSVLVTSMNLLESSSKNSMEICISINDEKAQKDVRGYVKTLLQIAQSGGRKVITPLHVRPTPGPRLESLKLSQRAGLKYGKDGGSKTRGEASFMGPSTKREPSLSRDPASSTQKPAASSPEKGCAAKPSFGGM